MSDMTNWATGFGLGSIAAFLYFWGLWLTVHRLKEALNPLGLYTTSLVLRLSLLGIAFAFVLNGDWRQVVAAAIAFVLVRFVVVFIVANRTPSPIPKDTMA